MKWIEGKARQSELAYSFPAGGVFLKDIMTMILLLVLAVFVRPPLYGRHNARAMVG